MRTKLFLFLFVFSVAGFSQTKPLASYKPGEKFKIKLKETVKVGDSLQITFNGNSHKSVSSDGPESPLGVSFDYNFGKGKINEEHWEYDKLPYKWKNHGYTFTVYKYEYDNWMEMMMTKSTNVSKH